MSTQRDNTGRSAEFAPDLDDAEFFPQPEARATGNATRTAQTTLEGGSYLLLRPVTFNRILVRFTGFTAPGTLKFMIFQRPRGQGVPAAGTPAPRVATVSGFAPGGTGNFFMTPAEGTVRLYNGVYYVLFGRDSAAGSIIVRTYTISVLDLSNANVEAVTHVTNYSTAILATATPATFDPRPAPPGEATPAVGDFSPIHRLVMV